MAGIFTFGKLGGAGADVGTAIVGKYGDKLAKIAIKSGSLTDDAASIAKFKSQKIAEINLGVLAHFEN